MWGIFFWMFFIAMWLTNYLQNNDWPVASIISALFITTYETRTEPEYIQAEYEREYNESLTFGDYECTQDCSWHEAGYEWAEDNGIDNEDDCGWNSNSFIEWCLHYVDENY